MQNTCKLDGQIEEIERLLKDATTNKANLEIRLAELKSQKNSEIYNTVVQVFINQFSCGGGVKELAGRFEITNYATRLVKVKVLDGTSLSSTLSELLSHNIIVKTVMNGPTIIVGYL